jgi:hypothetical protein
MGRSVAEVLNRLADAVNNACEEPKTSEEAKPTFSVSELVDSFKRVLSANEQEDRVLQNIRLPKRSCKRYRRAITLTPEERSGGAVFYKRAILRQMQRQYKRLISVQQ